MNRITAVIFTSAISLFALTVPVAAQEKGASVATTDMQLAGPTPSTMPDLAGAWTGQYTYTPS